MILTQIIIFSMNGEQLISVLIVMTDILMRAMQFRVMAVVKSKLIRS